MTTTYAERLARCGPPPASYDPAVAAKMPWAEAIPYIAQNADAKTLKETLEGTRRDWNGYRILLGRGVDPKTNPGIKKMLEEASKAIDIIAPQYPDLTMNGFHETYYRRGSDGLQVLVDEFDTERRRRLLECPNTIAQVATSIAFISQLELSKTPTHGSYGMKHAAEKWGRCHGMEPYVANGAFIVAALYSGVAMSRKQGMQNSPNCWLGFSNRSLRRVRDTCDGIERKLFEAH
jgi:hypothetical protein